MRGIDYVVEECPLVAGNTQLRYKDALNLLEARSPGTKQQFLFGFLDKARAAFERLEDVQLRECSACGQVTTGEICAFCKLADQVKRRTGPSSAAPGMVE